jgi:hypothetical protein
MKKTLIIALLICFSSNINAQKKVKTEGITSPTHQKHLNKIVFASDFDLTLNKNSEIESNFKNEFDLTPESKIYFRAYFDNSIYNYLRPLVKGDGVSEIKNYAIGFNFYIDNVLSDKTLNSTDKKFLDDDQKKTWTTFRGAIKKNEVNEYLGEPQFKEFLDIYANLLSTGKHKIKVEIYPVFINPNGDDLTKGNIIATGEFTLNAKNYVLDPNDEKLCLGKNVMNDNVLIKNIAQTLSNGNSYKVSPNAVRILSSSWKIDRNKYSGIVERRYIEVLYGYKKTTDNKCYRANYTVYQDYIGSKFSDELMYKYEGSIGLPMGKIDCKCLNQ